jgi:CheY-like chemotaxis protein
MRKNKGTIMVVDDSAAMRHLIKKALEPEGYAVIEAGNGVEALDRVLSDEPPDLITLDIEMPEMDGITMCSKIRNVLHLDEFPIIFLTSMASQQQLLKVFQAGATDYLIRPFLQEELLARLRVHLERSMLIRQLRRTITELNRAEGERVENQRLQGVVEMAGAVCHELNQPIQTISGFAELMMMKGDESDPLIAYARKIKQQVDRMGTITGKLMHVTAYRTKAHDAVTCIIDLEEATGDLIGNR